VGELINEFILGPPTDEYNLDLSIDYKPVMSVEDLVAITSAWIMHLLPMNDTPCRIRCSCCLSPTPQRAGALIESGCTRILCCV